jgi:tetratricopeptide (TPR) repeat protein
MSNLPRPAGSWTRSWSLRLLSALALLLFLWQVPLVNLVQRQAGLLVFLQAAWPAEALPVEQRPAEFTAAQDEALQAAAWQLQQAGSQLDTDRALGRVTLAANRFTEAEAYLLRWLDTAPNDPIARNFLAETYFRQGNVPAAIEQWAIARDSARLIAWARELIKLEQPIQALEALEAVIAFDPSNLSARQMAGDLWLKQGNSDRALVLYGEIISIAPEQASGYALTGSVLFKEKRYGEAIASFQQALQKSETSPYWVWVLLGQSYAYQGRWTEAVESYDQAIHSNPKPPEPYAFLGQAQCQLGHPGEARLAYEQAIGLGHQAASIRQTLEYIAQHGDCPDKASEKE